MKNFKKIEIYVLYYITLYYSKYILFINEAMFAHAEFFNVYNIYTQTK